MSKQPLDVRRSVGYMPDNFGVYDGMKVWEFLDFFAVAYQIPRVRRKQVIDDVLELLDLTHKRDDFVNGLSRGMKQRLCLAKTLVHDPPVLILDEPSSGLDPRARLEVKALLKELRRMGKTILISSHILSELADCCTSIGIIERGRLLMHGPIDEVYRRIHRNRQIEIKFIDGMRNGPVRRGRGGGAWPGAGRQHYLPAVGGEQPPGSRQARVGACDAGRGRAADRQRLVGGSVMTTGTAITSPHNPEQVPAISSALATGRTWAVITTCGHIVTGYLPSWAQEDPSRTGVPVERLGNVLADICHWAEFPGQTMRVARDGGPGTDTVVLGGSIDYHPYTGNISIPTPSTGVPVVNLQIIDDYWMHNLDPYALATVAAKMRVQADYLDHEVRPALIAARADWAAYCTG